MHHKPCTFLECPKPRIPQRSDEGRSIISPELSSTPQQVVSPSESSNHSTILRTSSVHSNELDRNWSPTSFQIPSISNKREKPHISLEAFEGRTVLFGGAHGQQDRSVFSPNPQKILGERDLLRRQVDPCDDHHNHLPVRFSLLTDVFNERGTSLQLETSNLIEKQKRFLQLFTTNREKLSPALRGCIYGIGAGWLSFDDVLGDRPGVIEGALIAISRTALDRELDSPTLETLQACLLMLQETPQSTSITESPRLWACVGQAVSVAQSPGLLVDPMSLRLDNWEKILRKKLWWSIFQADKWYKFPRDRSYLGFRYLKAVRAISRLEALHYATLYG